MQCFIVVIRCSAIIVFFVLCALANADIYEYTDDNDAISFTDDPGIILKKNGKSNKVRTSEPDDLDLTETRFKLINNHIVVPVTVSYKGRDVVGQFVLDTGAAGSVISPHLSSQFEINPRDTDIAILRGVTGFGVAGTVVVDSIKIGPVRVGSVEVAVAQFGNYDGLLGNDVLSSARFQIDYGSRRISWQ